MTPEELIAKGRQILEFIKEHKLSLGVAALLAGGLAIATTSYINKKTREYEQAWKRIGELTLDLNVAQFQEPKVRQEAVSKAIEEYKSMLENVSAGKAAPWLLYELGNSQYVAQKYDEAIATFKDFLTRYSDHPLVPFVRQCLGYAFEEKDHFDAAIQYLQGNAPKDNPFLLAQERWDIGRCYEKMGRIEEAKRSYQEAIGASPNSPWAELAQYRLDKLQSGSTP